MSSRSSACIPLASSSFGAVSGSIPPFDLIRLSSLGSLYVIRPTLQDYISTRAALAERATDIFGWVADGSTKLRIAHTYPLAEAAQAHREFEGRHTTGKLLLLS